MRTHLLLQVLFRFGQRLDHGFLPAVDRHQRLHAPLGAADELRRILQAAHLNLCVAVLAVLHAHAPLELADVACARGHQILEGLDYLLTLKHGGRVPRADQQQLQSRQCQRRFCRITSC